MDFFYPIFQWILSRFLPAWTPESTDGVWIHASSVGEIHVAASLVHALRDTWPHIPLLVTAFTPTGHKRAQELFGALDGVEVHRFPGDDRLRLAGIFSQFRPRVLLLIEAELWPTLLRTAASQQIPVVIANARLTPSAFRRYRVLGHWFAAHLRAIRWVLAQTQDDAERFWRLGVPPERIRVLGNLKFDLQYRPLQGLSRQDLDIAPDDCLVVFGSLRSREEDGILRVLQHLQKPGVKFILAPRHLDRVRPLIQKLQARRLPFRLRQPEPDIKNHKEARILILNTLGELWDVYAMSDIAVVGGTFAPYGGHSLLEPAYHGIPVIYGPYTQNVREVAKGLTEAGGGIQVQEIEALSGVLVSLLQDPAKRRAMGQRARKFVERHQGVTQRVLEYLQPYVQRHEG